MLRSIQVRLTRIQLHLLSAGKTQNANRRENKMRGHFQHTSLLIFISCHSWLILVSVMKFKPSCYMFWKCYAWFSGVHHSRKEIYISQGLPGGLRISFCYVLYNYIIEHGSINVTLLKPQSFHTHAHSEAHEMF